jgi:predicted nucleic acid-binding protein
VSLAYVDTSCLVAIAFDEPGATRLAARLQRFNRLFASNLLEAELRSALTREGVADGREVAMLSWLSWIYPNRPLTPEFARITALGYLKGADLWHLATALFLAPDGKGLVFLTLDKRQRDIGAKLRFSV